MVYYLNPPYVGIDAVSSLGDGYTINIKWFQAYATNINNKIAYHIYYSTEKEDVFYEGVKYVSIDSSLEANIINLNPGQNYYFSVRPVEYDSTIFNLENILAVAYDNLRVYPNSLLRSNITSSDLIIPLIDIDGFPSNGLIKVGVELIQYLSVDSFNKNLVLTNISQRGVNGTLALDHNIDGYDGYKLWNPAVTLFVVGEDNRFDRIYRCQSRFEYPNFPYTQNDGYHQVTKDILTTDLSASDESNIGFPSYDYAGYHRTDPVLLLTGACVGSYIGGEMGCIDGYGNVNVLRGLSVQDHNNQRQEFLLNVTGKPAVLIKRVRTGVTCACYRASSEYADDRCPYCYGTKFVFGYEQYFNPRRSDGRILVRPSAAEENLKMQEAGLESEFSTEFWTLTVPTIKNRDVIVLFDIDGNEEFRYEVMTVSRNNTLVGLQGGQKLRVQRIRKTDPAYQIRIFRDTSKLPSQLNTSIGMTASIPPHTHKIVVNENITSVNQVNQTTSVMQGHNHPIVNGEVLEVLGHTHAILLP
jgi:hypothetical protein